MNDQTETQAENTEVEAKEGVDYKGLFAEKGDFDIPATATIGLAWNPAQKGKSKKGGKDGWKPAL